jgi:FdhE protein
LERRAERILKARPEYQEMLDFYLAVFRRQIEWGDKPVAQPEPVDDEQRRRAWAAGRPLIDEFDPGIDPQSLEDLWTEMKAVFRRGNPTLAEAVDRVQQGEDRGELVPATWLREQRPDREGLVADMADRLGIDAGFLQSLTRAVTFPHWEQVSSRWLPTPYSDDWKRSRCPVCGGAPTLVETKTGKPADGGLTGAAHRYMRCGFCGSRWTVPTMQCPACESTKAGDAKYLFTSEEPELRIEFCKGCRHYIKAVDADKIAGPVHVGLEMLTSAHLDMIAQEKNLTPLETSA